MKIIAYLYLLGAIIFEVTATLLLPLSKNFTKPLLSIVILIFYSISFTIAYGASNFFLATADTSLIGGIKGVSRIAHMIVLVSGILVLLIVNYNLLTGRGLISEGFVESIRSPKHN